MRTAVLAIVFFSICVVPQAFAADDAALESQAAPAAEAQAEAPPAAKPEEELAASLGWFDGTVTRVRDVGLIEIDGEKMRLLGVTGPRRWWWGEPRDCNAIDSISYLEGLIKDKAVQYAFDPMIGPDNRRGPRRIYVLLEGRLINADMIAEGNAFADRSKPYMMREHFLELEDAAKLHLIGFWHTCPTECYRHNAVCRVKNW